MRACCEQELNPKPAKLGPALTLCNDCEFQFDVVHDAMPEPQRSNQPVDADAREEWIVSVY
jgi:hypothetical protein